MLAAARMLERAAVAVVEEAMPHLGLSGDRRDLQTSDGDAEITVVIFSLFIFFIYFYLKKILKRTAPIGSAARADIGTG